MASGFFVVVYEAISVPLIGVGIAARAWGLATAGVILTGIVALIAAIALVSLLRRA